ncbi:MAG: GNAT family N-acetyltransferase [Actinomycetota bacterium]
MAHTIEQIDTATAPETLMAELHDYYVVVEAEDMPGDPPTPSAVRIADWRHVPTRFPQVRWILRDDDGIAAVAVATYDLEENLENGFGRIHVHPSKRGRGYARAIATLMLDHLEEAGRIRFDTWIKEGEPAEQIARHIGLKPVYGEKRSRLRIEDLDMDLMDSWIERAGLRASDYELVYYRSPLPDDIVQKFCDLTSIMNTAPREDYEVDDDTLSVEDWREMESNVIDSKCQLHNLIAVHRPTGDFAGYTQIKTQDLQPELGWQWDTGVDPAHRNKGLGRWLKAAMIKRVMELHPDLERIDTWNAGSNEPMLNINVAMGFKPVHVSNTWQGPLADVRERFRA